PITDAVTAPVLWSKAEGVVGRGARRRGLGSVAKGEFSMTYRISLALVVLAALVLAAAPATSGEKGDKNVHSGKFVKAERDGKSFMMTDKAGKNEHKMTLAENAKILCDGKACKLSDLKEGLPIRVTTREGDRTLALRVEARTKESASKDGK